MTLAALKRNLVLAVSLFTMAGCAPDATEGDDEEAVVESESAVSTDIAAGAVVKVTASALNLRKTASTSGTILDVLAKNETVTVTTKSGATGWVAVDASGTKGFVSRQYVVVVSQPTDPDPVDPGEPSGGTCEPSRAAGAVNDFQKALHDAIAFAEGTRNHSKDGYNVMFSFKLMNGCQSHPNQCLKFGSTCSTAAGRYQFLTSTWNGAKSAKGLTSFEPENQERGAEYLVKTVRKVTVPSSRAMTASEFSNAMSKLSWEWASLPPGRYGQPNKTASQMRTQYCSLAGC